MAATDTILYRFLVRGGARAALESRNEVPLGRELVVETDTGAMKLGDGYTSYNDLDYVGGPGGDPIEMQTSQSHIQWRRVGDPEWKDLVALSELRGADGREVQMRVTQTHIQWSLMGGGWNNLVPLADLVGPPGRSGDATFNYIAENGDIYVSSHGDLYIGDG